MSMRSSLLSSSLSGKNLYPIICLVIAAISSVACFLPFLIPALQHPDDTDIIDAVGSEDYELAAYLSIAIAVPMMIEILTEAFNGTKEESGQFHLFVRVSLLASVTIPSIPIVIPSIFMNQTASTYLSINAVKRISAASCMLAFISRSINIHDKSAVKESKSDIFMLHMSSNRQGQLAVSVYFTYAMAELIWLYGSYYEYSLTDDTYSYRVAAMALYATAYFQVLLLIYFRKSWIDQSLSSILKTGRTGLEGSTDLGPLIPDLGPVIPDLGPLIPMNLQPSHSFTSFLSINSSNIKCSNIYLSVLVLYPIGTMLITAVLTGTNYMDTSSKDITAHLYFEMFLTLLAIIIPGRLSQSYPSLSVDPLWSRISAHEISSEVMIPLRELYQGIKAMKNNIITSSPNNLKNLSGKNCGINCGINCGNNDTLMEEGHSLLGEIETHEQNQEGSTKSVLPLLPNLEAITKIIEIHRGQRELPISASVSKKDKDGKLEGERAEAISSSKGVRTSTKERTASHSTCSEMASLNIVHGQQTTSVHGQQTSSVHGQQTSAVHGQQPPLSIASISNNTSLQHTPTTVQYSPITGNGDRGLEMISGLESGSEVDTREGQGVGQCQSQGHSQGLGQCQGQGLGQGLCQGVRHSTKHSLQHTQTELLQLLSDMEIQCGAAASRLSDFVLLEALDSGRIFLNVERVHPILFLYEITKKYEMISAQKRINMITDFGSRFDDSYIFIDSYELREAFEDLLSNTIRNTPIGGSIQITFTKDSITNNNKRRLQLPKILNWFGSRAVHPQGSAEGSAENSVNFIENNGRINALNNLNNGQYLVINIINSGCAVPLLKSELKNDLKNELKNDLKNDLKNVAINDDQNQKVRDNNNNKSKSRTPLGFTPSPRALSLRIAKGILELHKGTLICESDITGTTGYGTTVTIYLPIYYTDNYHLKNNQNVNNNKSERKTSRQSVREVKRQWINNPDQGLGQNSSTSDHIGWFIPDYLSTTSTRLPESVQERAWDRDRDGDRELSSPGRSRHSVTMLSSSELASVCRELDKNANSRWGDRNRDMDVEGERERESQRERDIGREMSRDMGRRRISSSAGWSDSPPRNLKLIGAQKGDRSSRQSSKQSSVRRILQFNRGLSIDQGQGGFRNDEKDSYNGNYNGYNGGDKNNLNSSCKDLESIGNSGNYSGNLSGNYSGNLSGNSVGNSVASSVASSIVKRGHSILDNLASLVSSRRSSGALEPLAEEQIRTPTRSDSQLIDGDFFDQISNVLKNLNAVSESEKHSDSNFILNASLNVDISKSKSTEEDFRGD